MPKRKRSAENSSELPGRAIGGRTSKRLQLGVANAHKQLQRAFKLAKGFERQKLGRRKKTAVKDGNQDQAARIDAEVEAWKGLELPVLASTYMLRLVEREKALRSSETLVALCQTDKHIPSNQATTTVAARLYNTNPVKSAVAESLPPIRAVLGIKDDSAATQKRSKVQQIEDDGDQTMESESENPSSDVDLQGGNGSSSNVESADEQINGRHKIITDADLDIGSEEEAGFDELEKERLGSNSDSGSSIDFEALKASGKHSRAADLSVSPPGSDADSSTGPSAKDASESDSDDSSDERPVSTSKSRETFLPTLSMGGYISGSESSASDIDEEIAPPRKNRRGQRARQKIWEAKFGHKAKHLQDQSPRKGKSRPGRDSGWDMKRGATSGSSKEGWRPGWARQKDRAGGIEQATGSNAVNVKPRSGNGASKKDEKPLHPSWEAKIKAKQKTEPGIGSFAGSKMTFD